MQDHRRGRQRPDLARGRRVFTDNGIFVVPDILANAGGVVVSYFEWVQNLQHFRWEEDAINHQLGTIMREAYRTVAERMEKDGTPMRVAAYEVGIERVLEAAQATRLRQARWSSYPAEPALEGDKTSSGAAGPPRGPAGLSIAASMPLL